MDNFSGYIVIGRYIPEAYKKRIKSNSNVNNKSIKITSRGFFESFKGLEGDMWLESKEEQLPTEDGILANIEDYVKVFNFYKRKSKELACDFIFLSNNINKRIPKIVEEEFLFCGYEVGIYETVYNYWSCIANEVVYGCLSEMANFSKHLNSCFLLNDIEEAYKLLETRKRLCLTKHKGKELEDIECEILNIYLYEDKFDN